MMPWSLPTTVRRLLLWLADAWSCQCLSSVVLQLSPAADRLKPPPATSARRRQVRQPAVGAHGRP